MSEHERRTDDLSPEARAAREAAAAEAQRTRDDPGTFPARRQEEHGELGVRVREDDLEPHAGLRYIARLFKALAVLLILLLIAEVIVGFMQEGSSAAVFLMIEATRLIVFAGLLWAAGDMAVMLVESNHDVRALRILVGRLLGRLERLEKEER